MTTTIASHASDEIFVTGPLYSMDSHITVTGVHSIGKNAGFCNDIQQKI
jgi:hypothetical protein